MMHYLKCNNFGHTRFCFSGPQLLYLPKLQVVHKQYGLLSSHIKTPSRITVTHLALEAI